MKINSDNPAKIDLLERKEFAVDIAFNLVNSFKNGSESIVFGLNGKWGSGKSTLLDFIKCQIEIEHLKNERKYIILEFNPWMFSGQEELQSIFLAQLSKKLDSVKSTFDHAKSEVKKNALKFSKIISPIGVFLKYFSPGLGEGLKDLKNCIKELSEKGPLPEVKKKVDDLIVKSNLNVYITIDDIDRLPPKEIIEIFQLIKLNANFKNTKYIIAYDRVVVQKALIDQYKESGHKYLDKIIQVDYIVPEILNEIIENIFFDEIKNFLDTHEIKYEVKELFDIWYYHRFKDYFQTLRDVYRFINALHFRLPRIHRQINITDFIILEGIRVFDSNAYHNIYLEFSEIIRSSVGVNSILGEEFIDKFPIEVTQALMNFLFSKKQPYTSYNYESEKDLCDPKYFERYYSLKISNKDIFESELEKFIKDKNQRFDILRNLQIHGRNENLLRRLSNPKLSTHYKINDPSLFQTLLSFWDDNENSLGPVAMNLWDALKNLAENFDDPKEGYKELFEELIREPGRFSFTRLYFLGLNIDNIGENFRYDLYSRKEIVLHYKDRIHEALINLLKTWHHYYLPELSKAKSYFFCKYCVLKYAKEFPNGYTEKLHKILNKSDDILILLTYFLNIDSNSNKPFNIDFTYKDLLLPESYYNLFVEKIKSIDSTLLNENNKNNLDYFKEYIKLSENK